MCVNHPECLCLMSKIVVSVGMYVSFDIFQGTQDFVSSICKKRKSECEKRQEVTERHFNGKKYVQVIEHDHYETHETRINDTWNTYVTLMTDKHD